MNDIDERLIGEVKKVGDSLFQDVQFDDRVKQQILNKMDKSWKKGFLNRYKFVAVAAVLLLVGSLSLGVFDFRNQGTGDPSTVRSGPAPAPFASTIGIEAASYPVHPDQFVTIQSQNKQWKGSQVQIYQIPTTSANISTVFNKKMLPSDAKPIGKAPIQGGEWSFKWQVPSSKAGTPYGEVLLVAQSDQGTFSGVQIATLNYKNLQVTPSSAQIGQEVKISGSGFAANSKVVINLLYKKQGQIGNLLGQLGSFVTNNGDINFSFQLMKELNGHPITSGNYQVQVVIIPVGQQRADVVAPFTVL